MNWFSHWDEDLEDKIVPLDNPNDFKIPTGDEINALFATNEKTLRPCLCGGKVELTGGTYGYPTFWIRCLKCGGQWSMDTYSPKEAAEKWGIK